MNPEDAQLLEILIAKDKPDRSSEASEKTEESDSLLARVPERTAASFTIGHDILQQGSSKKGILKKGDALRRASANAEMVTTTGR